MGLIAQCDGGCGATTDDVTTFKEFGIVKKVSYCEKCEMALADLYAARDEIHTEHAQDLAAELLVNVAVFVDRNPKAKLPDAPE
jgi:hypothetical protein